MIIFSSYSTPAPCSLPKSNILEIIAEQLFTR